MIVLYASDIRLPGPYTTDASVHSVCVFPPSKSPFGILVAQLGKEVGVRVTVAVLVTLAVTVRVVVRVLVDVRVLVEVRDLVGVRDGENFGLRVAVRELVRVLVAVLVAVAVAEGVTAACTTASAAAAFTLMRGIDKGSLFRVSMMVLPDVRNQPITIDTDALGTIPLSSAHAPATCGVAIDVPG